jgi:hypothetical protein
MQVAKGLFADGCFTPINNTTLPRQVHEAKNEERQARTAWLARLRQARQEAEGEPLSEFPSRTPMKPPHGLTD